MMPTNLSTHCSLRGTGTIGAAVMLCVALFAAPQAASATMLVKMDTAMITRRSARIVVGTVTAIDSQIYSEGVRTVVHMQVARKLKGTSSDLTIFYVPGGVLPDGSRVEVDGMPRFVVGETACVFVDTRGWVDGGFQGKVALTGARVSATGQDAAAYEGAIQTVVSNFAALDLPSGMPDPVSGSQAALAPAAASGTSATITQASSVAPFVSSITPGVVSAGTHSDITITGSGFGSAPGTVRFVFQSNVPTIPATVIDSWTDTRIVCEVPVATVKGYPAAAGSGYVTVTNSNGLTSATEIGSPGISVSFAYGGVKWHWAAGTAHTVPYRFNAGGVAGFEAAIDAGARTWNAAGANFAFSDGGYISTAISTADSINEIGWSQNVPAGVLAQTTPRYWSGTDQIISCDVEFNGTSGLGYWGSGGYDMQSVATHELGHWLNLRDLYGAGDSTKMMCGIGPNPGSTRRTLSSGDIAGILYIYGAKTAPDTTPPVTVSDVQPAYIQTATIHLDSSDGVGGSGVDATYVKLDGGAAVVKNLVTTSVVGTHTLLFWSVDNAGNREATHTATFTVSTEKQAPVTVSDVQTSYAGVATIHLTATDNGGSGVRATYASLDHSPTSTTTAVSTSVVGTHTVEFWSVDNVGNVEVHHTATFTVTPGPALTVQALTTPVTPASVRHRVNFTIYGFLQPHFAAGTHVTLKFYRYQSKKWVLRKTLTVHVFDNSGVSKYSVRTSLLYTGSWRVRSYRAFALGSNFSPYRYFKVRT